MRELREPRPIIEAAEQAAAGGNYASAEALLREAALVQEARLGPLHPDLANTLNNLGVVCEITEKPVDAEHYFRRALTIAKTAFDPDHPFVVTSRKNLRDFCEARGRPVDLPVSTPAATAKLKAKAIPSTDPPRESHALAKRQALQAPVRRRSFGRLPVGALGPAVMLIVVLAVWRPWLASTDGAESSSTIAVDSAPDSPAPGPAPAHAPVSVEPVPELKEPTKIIESEPDEANASGITAASTPARPVVVKAQLCAELGDWNCDPPDRPVPSGPLFFYTQVKSTSATTVQHRWYHNDRLQHSVDLRVEASPSAGYRSFSRYTMNGDSAGSWKVELKGEDGAVLYEERFTVR